jgi:bisphosphoglycerate-independent phosphoglycerate mutase (AlkP superfamily)
MFTDNDKSLIRQMIKAGRFNAIHDLIVEDNKKKAQLAIVGMGSKWCLHPSNRVKRLEVPLP